jgi:hypothetical protein
MCCHIIRIQDLAMVLEERTSDLESMTPAKLT